MGKQIIREGKRRPKIGIVLGSGGVKCMGGIEIFDMLAEREIPIDLIVGSSGGAVVGAVACMGYSTAEMRNVSNSLYTPEIFAINYKAVGAMLKLPFMHFDESMGLFNELPVKETFKRLCQGRLIEQSKIPLRIQATDLETGEGVVFTSGDCATAVQASSAAVPFLPPCQIDGRWMIDGAFSQPLPIMEAVRANMDVIIAMSFEESLTERPNTFVGLTTFLMNQTQRNVISTQTGRAVSFHHHEIIFVPLIFDRVINLWEAETIPLVYEAGRRAAEGAMPYIEKAIEDFYALNPE